MKKFSIAIIGLLFAFQASFAQSTAAWVWGIADIADISAGNPAPTQHVAAASATKVLWGMLQNQAINYSSFYFGSYKLAEYDNTGTPGVPANISGKLYISYAKADDAGNWYILGQYYDTIGFPGGPTFTNPAPAAVEPYFIARLNAGTLSCAWAKTLYYASTFTLTPSGLYVPIDSASTTTISKLDLSTGNRTDLFTQPFSSHTSSIAVDGAGSVYLAGSCAFGGINFNGHVVPTTGVPYPVYLVKYSAGGIYSWHYLISDITCPQRELTLADDNVLYYSGKIFDSFTFGGHFVHQPRWVYDYLVCRMDSTGNIFWLTQQKDTAEGDASADNNCHAVAMADSSLSVYSQTRGYIDWGNGIISNSGTGQQTSVVNYSFSGGVVNWVKSVAANTVDAKNIACNGVDIWVTGNVYDSAAFSLDATTVPVVPITMTPYLGMLHTARGVTTTPVIANDKPEIQVVPVPATNHVAIIMPSAVKGNVRITLSDISGRQVYERIANGNTSVQLDVSRYSRGLYFISVSGENFRTVQKIILE